MAAVEGSNIPEELRKMRQWVCWHARERPDGKLDKIPVIPGTEKNAKPNDPETWRDFQTAIDWYRTHENCAGVGYVFSERDQFTGIDLDDCRDPETGNIQEWAQEIFNTFRSYSEVSQSGKGIHIIVIGSLPGKGIKRTLPRTSHDVEMYDRGRFFAITGQLLPGFPPEIRDCGSEVAKLYHRVHPPITRKQKQSVGRISDPKSDEEILAKLSEASNSQKFHDLMAGNWEKYGYPSESEADFALVNLIGFYTRDFTQITRIWQNGALWDDKCEDRPDYVERTIFNALSTKDEFYGQDQDIGTATVRAATTIEEPGEATTTIDMEPAPEPFGFPEFSIERLMPPDGFLKDYLDYMLPITEAPPQFHLFSGLVALATVIGPRVYFTIADDQKYCNLWVVLTGPSGCKKSTSINKPRRMLASGDFKKYLFPVQITSERLIPMLAENAKEHQGTAVGTFFWSEWGATMDQWSKTYAQDTMSVFTSLFDGGYFSRWLKGEKYEIENSCVNLLCGCTLSWLKKTIKQGVFVNGKVTRMMAEKCTTFPL